MTQELAAAKTVALTTFRKDGSPVVTPIWIAETDSRLVSMTQPDSYKVKRLHRNAQMTLAVCDTRGNVEPGTTLFQGTARILSETETLDAVSAVRAKYGMMAKVMGFFYRLRGSTDQIGIEYTLA